MIQRCQAIVDTTGTPLGNSDEITCGRVATHVRDDASRCLLCDECAEWARGEGHMVAPLDEPTPPQEVDRE